MRRIIAAACIVISAAGGPAAAQGLNYVPPGIRSDGTFRDGHFRTAPNGTRLDNYSTRGNTNPFTGQRGSQPAFPTYNPPRYTPPPVYGGSGRRR